MIFPADHPQDRAAARDRGAVLIRGAVRPTAREEVHTVSYTHLDVYKRQAYKSNHKGVEIKTIELYIVANEGTAYYVVNGEANDDFKVVL